MFNRKWEVQKNDLHHEIERSVSVGNNLEFTKELLEAKFETKLNDWNCKYVEDYYVDSLKHNWFEEAETIITDHVNPNNILKIRETLKTLNNLTDCYSFILNFGFIINKKVKISSSLYSYIFLLKELYKTSGKLLHHEKQYVREFKNLCVQVLMCKAQHIKNEYHFFKTFLDLFKLSKNPEEVYQSLELPNIQDLKDEVNFKCFLDILLKSQNGHISQVKQAAKRIIHQNDFIFITGIADTISSFFKPTTVKQTSVDERNLVEVFGSHIVISKVLDQIEKIVQNKRVEEVHFVATVIHIDEDFSARVWHGQNIVVVAETAILSDEKSVTWDVSGKDALSSLPKAGTGANGCGLPGADGENGESGGNVLIRVDELINGDNFNVASNGGNGGIGQTGGDGDKGEDGSYLKEEHFKVLFPPISKYQNKNKRKHLNITKDTILRNFGSLDECYAGRTYLEPMFKEDFKEFLNFQIQNLKDFYFKLRCDNGYKVTLSFYYGRWNSVCQSFVLHEGSPGEKGKPGGLGGREGVEGFAGDVVIEVNNRLYSNCILPKDNGKPGKPGNFGNSGKPGKKGPDIAYIDYSINPDWPRYVKPKENQDRKLYVKYSQNSSSNSVFTAHKNLYAEIVERENGFERENKLMSETYNIITKQNNEERTMLEKLSQRKKTICKEIIRDKYEQKLHKTGLFKFDLLIKNAESLIGENNLFDETLETQSEHITTEFKITHQVITCSGNKRLNLHSSVHSKDLTHALEGRPSDSLKELSADKLIELVRNDPSPPNWIKLLRIRLNLSQLKCLWEEVVLKNRLNEKINDLEMGFCNKFQLAALEYYARKFDSVSSDYDCTSNNNCNNRIEPTDMSLNSFKTFFTINKNHEPHSLKVIQYFLGDSENNTCRHNVLKKLRHLLTNPLDDIDTFNAIVVVIINEFLTHYNNSKLEMSMGGVKVVEGIGALIDNKKKRVSANLAGFKNAIQIEQNQTIYNDLLRGIVKENNNSLVKFANETEDDQLLSSLYESFVGSAQEQQHFWKDVTKLRKFAINKFLSDCFLISGPFHFLYREFLAYHLETNILVYSINENKVIMTHNHNPRATSSVHLLMEETTFLHLSVNKHFVEMLSNHQSKCTLFKNVQIYMDSLNINDICKIVSKQPFTLDLINDVCDDKSLKMSINIKHIFMEDVNIRKILESYDLGTEKELLSRILEKFRHEYTGCSSILDILALHFESEKTHISSKELIFVLNFVLKCSLNVPHVLPLLTWILAAYSQKQWLVEMILLKLELKFQKTLETSLKSKWRKYISVHEGNKLLMLIMEKICEENFSEENFEETIYLLCKIPQGHLGLSKVRLEEWMYYLKDKFWTQQLKELGISAIDSLQSASYYLMVLENIVGTKMCEKLIAALKVHKVELSDVSTINKLPGIFRTIANEEVCLNDLLRMLELCSISEWVDVINKQCFSNGIERSVFELAKLMKNSSNTSEEVLKKLDFIVESVNRCNSSIRHVLIVYITHETILKEFISKLLDSHRDTKDHLVDIRKRATIDLTFKGLAKSLIEIHSSQIIKISDIKSNKEFGFFKKLLPNQKHEILLATVVFAIEVKYNKTLRGAQIITIMTMLQSEKNVLCQVATGEGKSLIVVAVAIIKVLMGQQKVDIVTSSRVLAKRDAELYKDLYELFGIHVGHNCSESIDKRKKVYSSNRVVYGELANFQRDFLIDCIHNHNIRGDREFDTTTIIIDEVDSMLLDKGNNTLYLSHEIPGVDKLESVFIHIWKALHILAESDKLKLKQIVSSLKENILHQLFGIVAKEDLRCLDTTLGNKEVNNTWHFLLEQEIIDGTGKVLKQLEDRLNVLPENCIHEDHLKYLFKKVSERTKSLEIPNYLKRFVEKHLEEWISSGIKAMKMEPGVDYVVDIDRSESSYDRSPNIMIIDQDTGTDLVHSQWENGLHQFLQIKHGCRLSLITLKAVFISNVSFLRKYKSLYGLTGTLGSQLERKLLHDHYTVDYVTIPTAKTKNFIEEVPIVCKNTVEWLDTICIEACKKTESRSVLIVCETVNNVKTLKQKFIEFSSCRETKYKQIHTYTRDYEEFAIAKSLEPGHIIISTNLAGRGTDIKLTKGLIDAGGLHVCLSYSPGNGRTEEQAFGRAARNGEPGSGQLIVNSYANNNVLEIIQIKYQRVVDETIRTSDIMDYYNSHIKVEETLFDKFLKVYESISKSAHPEDIKSILLHISLDQWASWLEENKMCLHLKNVEDFLIEMSNLKETEFSIWSTYVKNPFQMVKLGLVLIEKGQIYESILLFDRVIKEEPLFSETAYYYRLMANSSDRETIVKDLKFVVKLLKERVKSHSIHACMVDYLKEKNLKAVLQVDSFKEQQLNVAKILDVFLQSIYKIVGCEISKEEFLQLPGMSDEIIASRVFSDLIREDIIKGPSVKQNISERDFPFAVSYGIDPKEMNRFFKTCEGQVFNEIQLLNELKTSFCNLPSRELFWSLLFSNNILTNEKSYCIVDLQRLRHVDPSLINYVETLKETNIKQGNEIWMYQLEEMNGAEDNCILVRKEVLVEGIGESKYTYLLNKSIVRMNSLATFMPPNVHVEFENFDCLRESDFLKLGISLDIASNIIVELQENQQIKKKQRPEGGYMLLVNYSDIINIELKSFKAYSDDVIKLLNFCFAFRIALQKMCELVDNHSQNDNALYLPLPIRIHHNIIRDLYEHEIISEHIINPEKDISMVLATLYPEAMTREEYCALFDGLFDSSTGDDIVDSLILIECLKKQDTGYRYVIELENLTDLPSDLEYQKDTIKLVLERQKILGTKETKKIINQIVIDHSSILHQMKTPDLNGKPLSHVLQQTQIPLSECKMFSLNGFDTILVLKENKIALVFNSFGLALFGFILIVYGAYFNVLFLPIIGVPCILEGISRIRYAVTYLLDDCSWGQFPRSKGLNLLNSVSSNSVCSILNVLSKFKSIFGQNLVGDSVLPHTKNEHSSILNKATRFVKNVFKSSQTEAKINKTMTVQTLAKHTVTQLAHGHSFEITCGIIDNYLKSQLEKLVEDLVEQCSIDVLDVASNNLSESIKDIYLLLEPKEAQRIIRMCYSSVVQECRIHPKNDWNSLLEKLCTIADKETLSGFQKFHTEITPINVCDFLPTLGNVITELQETIDSYSYIIFSGNSMVANIINNFEQNLTIKLKELRKTRFKTSQAGDCMTKMSADEILNDLEKEVKSVLEENLRNYIINPLLDALNTMCINYLSSSTTEKYFDLATEEDVMEKIKSNEEKYKAMEFEEVMEYEQKAFYHMEYNEFLLEILERKKSVPIFLEILESNYSIDRFCIELCCSIIPMALRKIGLNLPILRLVVEKNGSQHVYGCCNGSEQEVITITMADNKETNTNDIKIPIRSLFDSVYETVFECYPGHEDLTSEDLHMLVITAIENDPYIKTIFRDFDTNNSTYIGNEESNDDIYKYIWNTGGKKYKDTTEHESSSHLRVNMDVKPPSNSESDIKALKNAKDEKMYVIKSFNAALKTINTHLYKTQPYLKSFSLTLEDFVETSHTLIPSHGNEPGKFFDYYATGYELVIPFFVGPDSEQCADYIVKMTLNGKKHSNLDDSSKHLDLKGKNRPHIYYSVEPKDRLGRLDWGMGGCISLDVECGDRVYTAKDCHSAGELAHNDEVEVMIFGDSIFRYISHYIPKYKFLTKNFPDNNSPSKWKSTIVKLAQIYSNAQCVVLYFGNHTVKTKVCQNVFVGEIRDLVTQIRLKMNNVKIILCEVLYPLKPKFGRNKNKVRNKVNAINQDLKNYCIKEDVVFFRTNSFVSEQYLLKDGLHLNRKGYAIISKAILDQIHTSA